MFWRCAKGHEWTTTFYQVKNMGRCYSQCAGNFPCGLSEAKEIAHSRGVITNISPPSSIHRPDFLNIPEHSRGLELDIYYPQYRFAIEVQGKQHEQHCKIFS
ncbi:hypothetical protein RhiirC2_771693 [Rhizophagus irregularis]|uniref:Uncharacterized protein n=1 Tax=Rhizophagus irregularis TaxID=588596 RepID=A0A2N1NTB7_9GLOM|nr:hypothetical protein RhiirC2_771693 [Rhizophagus irregularis]